MKIAVSAIVLFLTFGGSMSDENQRLMQIFSDYDEFNKRNYPMGATYDGDNRYDDLVTDNSEEGINARYDSLSNFLKRLSGLDYNSLTESNKLNYDLLKDLLRKTLNSGDSGVSDADGSAVGNPYRCTSMESVSAAGQRR